MAGALGAALTARLQSRPACPPSSGELRLMLEQALAGSSVAAVPAPSAAALSAISSSNSGSGSSSKMEAADGLRPLWRAGSSGRSGAAGAGECEWRLQLSVRSVPGRSLGGGSGGGGGGYFGSDVMVVTCTVRHWGDRGVSKEGGGNEGRGGAGAGWGGG